MKYAQMVCAISQNVGDDIQSIAAARLLPRVDLFVDREQMGELEVTEPLAVIMNAWFMHGTSWPPSPAVHPIFVGFHVAPESRNLVAASADYLRSYEPIGTRDKGTADFLTSLGIRAEVTYCLTLTFPERKKEPANGKVMIVDARQIVLPDSLRRGAVRFSQKAYMVSDKTKLQHAQELLDHYKDHAKLVVTTRLHCALPCIAMGIPVVFFGDSNDYRTAIVRDIGGTIYDRRLHSRGALRGLLGRIAQPVDWSPRPLDVTPFKARLLAAVSQRLAKVHAS